MDLLSFLRTIAALGTVLGLLAGALWFVRRYNIALPGQTGVRDGRRLALVERVGIDAKRSIILVRRDDREHLIMVSPDGQMVIESNISRDETVGAAPEPAWSEPLRPTPARAAARPAAKRSQSRGAPKKPPVERGVGADRADTVTPAKVEPAAAKMAQDFATLVDLVSAAGAKAKAVLVKSDRPLPMPEAELIAPPKPRPPVRLKVTGPDGRTVVEPVPTAATIAAVKAAA
jgi:flagellar protein FliO/FliZ